MPDANLQDLPLWNDLDARAALDELCSQHRVPRDVLEELVGIVRDRLHQERRHGINDAFAEVIGRMED
jgi:hypothetical protein